MESFPSLQDPAFVGYSFVSSPGVLRITGEDRLAFIQRQTTNDVRNLPERRALPTVLTSPTGRILDVLTLHASNQTLWALTLASRAPATARYLQSRIFFMDRVSVADISDQFCQFELDGLAVGGLIEKVTAGSIASDGVWEGSLPAGDAMLLGRRGFTAMGATGLFPAGSRAAVEQLLAGAGAKSLDSAVYEALRIEAGFAGPAELNEQATPLEAGMRWAVSQDKGCYTGQEVLARQINFDKVTRMLARLKLASPAAASDRLFTDGEPVGEITSAAVSPRLGPIALAYVRRSALQPGHPLTARTTAGEVSASIIERSWEEN